MTDVNEPKTFRADRWRFARDKTGRRLLAAFRSFFSNATALTIAFILGGILFGAAYILDEAEAYVAELLAIAAMPALALLAWPAALLYYWLRAPAAMWRRDQDIIAQLRASFTPALRLMFDDQCLRYVPRGRVTSPARGHRFHDGEGSDRHVLIKCVSCSKAAIEGVQVRMVDVKGPPPDQEVSLSTQFFHAVRLKAFNDDADTTTLPPGGETFFCALIQPTEFDPPRPNERESRYHYEFLFTRPGTYEIGIAAHGTNTPVAEAVLMIELKKDWVSDGMGHKHPRYEIVSVRPKDVD